MPRAVNMGALPIVSKLRGWPATYDDGDALSAGFVASLCEEAADTIERLHEALEEAVRLLGNHAVHEDDLPPLEAALAKARGEVK